MSRTFRFRHLPVRPGEPEKYVDSNCYTYRNRRDGEVCYRIAHVENNFPCVEEEQIYHFRWWSAHYRCCDPLGKLQGAIEERVGEDVRNAVSGFCHRAVGYIVRKTSSRRVLRRELARRDRFNTRAILRDDRNWTDDYDEGFPDTPNCVDWELS